MEEYGIIGWVGMVERRRGGKGNTLGAGKDSEFLGRGGAGRGGLDMMVS